MKVVLALRARDEEDHVIQLAWRRTVASVLSGVVVAGALIIGLSYMWMNGMLPGVSGVALASDLTTLKHELVSKQDDLGTKVDLLSLREVKNDIKQALKNKCTAIYAKNQQALDNANGDLDSANSEFRRLRGYDYPQLNEDCSVILIQPDH